MDLRRKVHGECWQTWVLGLGGAWYAVFIGAVACTTRPVAPPNPVLSPPVAEISENPWSEAERLSASVPNSTLMVGHGASMLPLYPSGTVLVLQALQWDHLRAGMTVVYYKAPDTPFAMVAHVLKAKDGPSWETQGLNTDQPDDVAVTRENYIGTVVAAFRRATPASPQAMVLAQLYSYQPGTCLMRCHVGERGKLPGSLVPNKPGTPR